MGNLKVPRPLRCRRVGGAGIGPSALGVGAGGVTAAESPHDDTSNADQARIKLVALPQQAPQVGVDSVPDPEFFPKAEPPMGRAARAAHFQGNVFPAAAGDQDESDDLEGDAVGDGRPTAFGTNRLYGRPVMSDHIIELVG